MRDPEESTSAPGAGRADRPLTIVALGTSLTAGGTWVEALPAAVGARIARRVRAVNLGRSGATSRDGLELIEHVIRADPDIVLIEFAINDAAIHRRVSLRQSIANLTTIIARLKGGAARARLYLMTMNPAVGLRKPFRWRLPAYYAAYAKLAAHAGTGYIDNLPAWRAFPKAALRRAIPDGVHPSPEFAARVILTNVVSALARDLV
jgi:acyl-CoA thioesterase I